jgi:hypothetical protein
MRRYSPVLWVAIYLILQTGAPFLHLPIRSPGAMLAAMLVSAAVFTCVSLAVYASLTFAVRRPATAALLLVFGAAGWVLMLVLGPMPPNPPNLVRLGGGVGAVALRGGESLFWILATAGLGVLLASGLREPNILLPAAVFAAFADYFVVHFGTVHHALKSPAGQHLIQTVSAKVPTLPGLPILTVGPADFVFLAFFLACVYRFDLQLKRTLVLLSVLLTFALFFVTLLAAPVPALVPMALAFVVANFRSFRLSPSEKQAMGAAAVIVAVVTLGFLLLGRR